MAEEAQEPTPTVYEIRIKGHLGERWADRFEGMAFAHERDGTTTLCGVLADQAALRGLLDGLMDLGVALISVQQKSLNREKGSE
jgi:hypothetical protein